MPGIYILGIESAGEDLEKRVLFWLDGPRKAKRCDIAYGVALRSVFASGSISCIGSKRLVWVGTVGRMEEIANAV